MTCLSVILSAKMAYNIHLQAALMRLVWSLRGAYLRWLWLSDFHGKLFKHLLAGNGFFIGLL